MYTRVHTDKSPNFGKYLPTLKIQVYAHLINGGQVKGMNHSLPHLYSFQAKDAKISSRRRNYKSYQLVA